MSIVHSPPSNPNIADRSNIQTKAMEHKVDYVIENRNRSITTLHFKTIPPGLGSDSKQLWIDIISQRDEIRAIEIGKVWNLVHFNRCYIDDIQDSIRFCIENYYNLITNME